MRYPALVLGACGLVATYHYITARPIEWRPGTLVAAEPEQTAVENAEPIVLKGFRLTPRARFSAEARVLSRSRYFLGTLAKVSPLDIAVGWGEMSDSAVLKRIDVSQSGRFYFWHYDDEPPIPRQVIEAHSANWHLVPASNATWHVLNGLRVGDVVKLEGELIDINGPDGGSMRTSLTRADTGAGACEIIYVEAASLRFR